MKVCIFIIFLIPLVISNYDKCKYDCLEQWAFCSDNVNISIACECLQQVADCFIIGDCYDAHNRENVLEECINLNCDIPACSIPTSLPSQSTGFNVRDIIVIIIVSLDVFACLCIIFILCITAIPNKYIKVQSDDIHLTELT